MKKELFFALICGLSVSNAFAQVAGDEIVTRETQDADVAPFVYSKDLITSIRLSNYREIEFAPKFFGVNALTHQRDHFEYQRLERKSSLKRCYDEVRNELFSKLMDEAASREAIRKLSISRIELHLYDNSLRLRDDSGTRYGVKVKQSDNGDSPELHLLAVLNSQGKCIYRSSAEARVLLEQYVHTSETAKASAAAAKAADTLEKKAVVADLRKLAVEQTSSVDGAE